MITVRKKEGESSSALLFRFSKKIKQSGVLKESKKRRFHTRAESRLRRRLSARHRAEQKTVFEKTKRMGLGN